MAWAGVAWFGESKRKTRGKNGVKPMIRSAQCPKTCSPARRLLIHVRDLLADLAMRLLPTHRSALFSKVLGLSHDQRGSAAILFALSMPMLIGGLGLGFE